MAPGTFTDVTPSRLITTPDWLVALFVQVSLTDVILAAFAIRSDGAAGMGVSLRITACAGGLDVSTPRTSAASVTDKPIGDAPDEAVAASEARARRLGLSRSEYVRRGLVR